MRNIFKRRAATTPPGKAYSLYLDMLRQPHLLIAGATGSGKSVILNGLISTLLYRGPQEAQLILLDPKRVELAEYRKLPHAIAYASEPGEMVPTLELAMQIIDCRYRQMQRAGLHNYAQNHVYLCIDELADLMTTNKRGVLPCLQRIGQIGRAANVHLIACTQCPLSEVIPTPLKVNFDARVGLRTRSAQDSRNILGVTGCERLPRFGQGYYMTPEDFALWNIPMLPDEERQRLIKWWT